MAVRRRAALAVQAVFDELGLPRISDEEVEAAVNARASTDMPQRDVVADLAAAERFLAEGCGGVAVIRALACRGFGDIAEKVLTIQKLRLTGEHLQTSAIVLPGGQVSSAVTDPNDYAGPGTGYRPEGERWREIAAIPQAPDPRTIGAPEADAPLFTECGEAAVSDDAGEIIIALGPAFGTALDRTLLGLPHAQVIAALLRGVAAEGMRARIVKIYATSDCGFIGHAGAQLSGSGVSIGIQSKGTTVIHRRDLQPLDNLELFPQAPNLTLESYEAIGRNAARYARGLPVAPVPVQIDNMARLRHIVRTTILHLRETEQVASRKPVELRLR
jgi:hypothetical protein